MLTHLQFEIQLGQWRNKLINLINAMVQYQPQEVNSILNGIRGGSRAVATSKMERFVIIVNGFYPLTIITKRSILVDAVALDPPLVIAKLIFY